MNPRGLKAQTDFQYGADSKTFVIMRYFLSLLLICFSLNSFAQSDSIPTEQEDPIKTQIDILRDIRSYQFDEVLSNKFEIYQTENIYILLKLNRQTGQIDLIQWSLKSKDEGTVTLNSEDLSWIKGVNSFKLYPTKNMYQFILLDNATGRTWHVQWGTKSSEMWIRRIY